MKQKTSNVSLTEVKTSTVASNIQLSQIICSFITLLVDTLFLGLKIVYYMMEAVLRIFIPPKEKSLKGEVAVVTGGGHGIGLEIVRQLSDLGVKIAVWDINGETAKQAVKEIEGKGGLGLPVVVDVSDRESVRRAVDVTRSQLGEVTLLINNAGIMPCKRFLNHSESDIEKLFSVNVFSHYWTLFEFLPRMMSLNRGHIVCMSSMAGKTGTPNLAPYCSSKYALTGLMEALVLELRECYPDVNIKTTTIHPFTVNTGLAKKPRTRFSKLIPITNPESAAAQTITAIRREYEYAYIPSQLCFLNKVSQLFPRKAQLVILDYLDCGVEEHD